MRGNCFVDTRLDHHGSSIVLGLPALFYAVRAAACRAG